MAKIVFVDENDHVIGAGTKEQAWKNGDIHRIARLFVFNSGGELLVHKRSEKLDNSPGKWDQSAAGHVDEGEDYLEAAKRELKEELGIEEVELKEIGKFYQDEIDPDGKMKKRFNMLYEGKHDGEINFNEDEVSEIRWIGLEELRRWMEENPEDFTRGFIESLNMYQDKSRRDDSD